MKQTTPEEIIAAWNQNFDVNLDVYDSVYSSTFYPSGDGPTIIISGGVVKVNGVEIINPIYSESDLSWSTTDGNQYNANLHFEIVTADPSGQALPAGSYLGPQFHGFYWASGETQPTSVNISGKVGQPPDPSNGDVPVTATPLSYYASTLTTYLKNANGKYEPDSTMVIAVTGSTTTVTYNDMLIKNYTYSNENLSWFTTDGNAQNVSVQMNYNKTVTKADPTIGAQFAGERWDAGTTKPASHNFYGQIGQSSDPTTAVPPISLLHQLIQLAANLGYSFAVSVVFGAVKKYNEAWRAQQENANAENEQAEHDAQAEVNQAVENANAVEQIAEQATGQLETIPEVPEEEESDGDEPESLSDGGGSDGGNNQPHGSDTDNSHPSTAANTDDPPHSPPPSPTHTFTDPLKSSPPATESGGGGGGGGSDPEEIPSDDDPFEDGFPGFEIPILLI